MAESLNYPQIKRLCKITLELFKVQNLPMRQAALVGSAYILPSPEAAKDIDLLILLEDKCDIRDVVQPCLCLSPEWKWGYDEGTYPLDGFESLRCGQMNLLFVNDKTVYDKWILSANLCRALKLYEREHRVMVHQIIMDGLSIPMPFSGAHNLLLETPNELPDFS